MPIVTSYTKAYIDALESRLAGVQVSRKTANYTLDAADSNMCIEMNVASANTVTIPSNATEAIPVGAVIYVTQYGEGPTTIVPGGSVTCWSLHDTLTLDGQYAVARLHKIAINEWYVSGDVGNLLHCNRQTDSYTLEITDAGKCVEINSADPENLTVPANADVPFPIGTVVYVVQYGAGVLTLVEDTDVTINSLSGYVTSAGQYANIKLHKIGTNEWYASGDLTTA